MVQQALSDYNDEKWKTFLKKIDAKNFGVIPGINLKPYLRALGCFACPDSFFQLLLTTLL
ncbi:hypothetical protein [Holospora curviuscula]|uniref:EF-hand domain-containing protein n=1 Tax=Holospora curviuscula TaxID=1082868 RepID=A0A2S5R9B0_9PROT|nr:hypothetical protein [Holospora curviuscula]PPE03715.1 hypothetical protein HCUR_00854 [Holospora curviuscula]